VENMMMTKREKLKIIQGKYRMGTYVVDAYYED
jgi:hypothetical protein